MKKKRCLAIALVFILSVMSLTGCGGKTKTDDSSLPLSVGSDMSPQLQENDRNLKMMTPSDVHTEIGFAAKEGIYECEAYGGKYVLYYTDYATNQKVALCNRPECHHNDDTCIAWMPNYGAPFVIGDKLYLWCLPEWTEDGVGPYYIQQRELDGSNPKNIWTAENWESLESAIVSDGTYFYFFTYQGAIEDENIESAIYWNRLDLANGKREKIASLSPYEGYDLVGAYGDTVFLFGFGGESGTDRAFYLMNADTFEITPGFSYDGEQQVYQYIDGKYFYLIDVQENSLKRVDLLTNEMETVFSGLGLAEPKTAKTHLILNNRYVSLYAYEAADNTYGQIVLSYALDLQEHTIQELPYRYEVEGGVTDPYQVLLALPNDKLLVAIGRETRYYKMEQYGLMEDIEFTFNQGAIISAEEFFSGTANFTPVEMNFSF